MWYFKNKATEKEKENFFKYIEKYKLQQIGTNTVKNKLRKLAEKYTEDYLLNSFILYYKNNFKNDFIDELWLKIYPITLGTGKRLFESGTVPTAFKVKECKLTPSGVILVKY